MQTSQSGIQSSLTSIAIEKEIQYDEELRKAAGGISSI